MNASETTTLFQFSMDCVKHLTLSEVVIKRCFTKQKLPSKSFKVADFWPFISATMCSILDAAGFLDPPLALTYRKNDGYSTLIINAISVYKIYIDF